jgi:Rieske Fe-S protein
MKKLILSAMFAVLVCAGTAFAQNAFEKTKKLTEGEVPVAVLKSFQKDHADLQDKGFWKLHYTEKTVGGKTVFTPEHYSFNAKKDGEKVVLTYTTDGTLESSKGAGAKN